MNTTADRGRGTALDRERGTIVHRGDAVVERAQTRLPRVLNVPKTSVHR